MMQLQDMPLLIVSLIVFAALFVYMFGVDARVRRMERELRDEIATAAAEDRGKKQS
jgi:CcmD family protein